MGLFEPDDEDEIFLGAKDAFPEMPTLDDDFERAMNFTVDAPQEVDTEDEPFSKQLKSNEDERLGRKFSGEQVFGEDDIFLKRYEGSYSIPNQKNILNMFEESGKKPKGLKGLFGL